LAINLNQLSELKDISFKKQIKLVAVTKNRPEEDIINLINNQILIFGENRVQEAQKKFLPLKKKFNNIAVHLIGPLQSNKAIDALKLFDCIQSIDREKIVKIISEQIEHDWCVTKKFLIQINIGNEKQKSGVEPRHVREFYHYCLSQGLNIEGLMCIPPICENVEIYFEEMNKIKQLISNELLLSMGMSDDYLKAINNGSNMIRIGSALFL